MIERNGTYYHDDTPDRVVSVLETMRITHARIRVVLGDLETGRPWGEMYGIEGRIHRSTGPRHIPILLHNSRSTGGGAILTHCILKIAEARGGHVYYQAKNYQQPTIKIVKANVEGRPEYTHAVEFNGSVVANCKSERAASAVSRRLD